MKLLSVKEVLQTFAGCVIVKGASLVYGHPYETCCPRSGNPVRNLGRKKREKPI